MVVVLEYEDEEGRHPFAKWFASPNNQAALKVRTAVARIENGNFSNVKAVGGGVNEYRLNFGPGYRVYFGMDGVEVVILLGGGTKKRQGRDIETAKDLWTNYKTRRRKG
ncbi:MAG: type II toxin-antitoxin system RelE/ParE family toxin [Alphaproteobacteria bacterium]|nr:type II toxin-antitoxin system RelE/ParE family toxin [Alphaproteobacteria bacterium]